MVLAFFGILTKKYFIYIIGYFGILRENSPKEVKNKQQFVGFYLKGKHIERGKIKAEDSL